MKSRVLLACLFSVFTTHNMELRFFNMKESVRGGIRQKPSALSFVYSFINLASWTHSDPASMIRAWCLVNLLHSSEFCFYNPKVYMHTLHEGPNHVTTKFCLVLFVSGG